jgi:ribonuclease HII
LAVATEARTSGPSLLAGVDEAGRGPLAGPVVAAAVMLDERQPIVGLADSKQLSATRRERLAEEIAERALAVGVAVIEAADIDRLNILRATLEAMRLAVAQLSPQPTMVHVDGNQPPPLDLPLKTLIGGDRIDPAISAASIVAKVHRDRIMQDWHERYPGYGFDRNKGYPTPSHLAALDRLGPCPAHRRSFRPVSQLSLL